MPPGDSLAAVVYQVEIVLAAALAVLCCAVYLRVPFWQSQVGRHLISFMGAVALVLVLSTAQIITGYAVPVWVRAVVFAPIPVVLGWRLVLLMHAQREELP